MKAKVVFGYVTALSILGFTGYAIYKHLKDKDNLDKVISFEDAKRDIEQRRNAQMDEVVEEFEDMLDNCRDQASFNRSFMPYDDNEEEEDIVDYSMPISVGHIPDDSLTEEDRQLKYEPSSDQARQQFINMELADLVVGTPSYNTVLKLFDFPFNPVNDGDYDLKTRLIDYRVQFFGFGSKWTQDISYAEVVLHYARSTAYNYDESIEYWVDYFFQFDNLTAYDSSATMGQTIEALNTHSYYNSVSETHGLFNLTSRSMELAIHIASRNVDTALTYDIEFNEFLKTFN